MFNVYSLRDVKVVMKDPSVGSCVISETGDGRIGYSFSGDMFQNTKTANGYVTVNRIRVKDGVITLEVPVNSDADLFLRKWINYLDSDETRTGKTARTTLKITDPIAKYNWRRHGRSDKYKVDENNELTFYGVVPQKRPDVSYDQTAPNTQYNLLFAEMEDTVLQNDTKEGDD